MVTAYDIGVIRHTSHERHDGIHALVCLPCLEAVGEKVEHIAIDNEMVKPGVVMGELIAGVQVSV